MTARLPNAFDSATVAIGGGEPHPQRTRNPAGRGPDFLIERGTPPQGGGALPGVLVMKTEPLEEEP